MSELEVSFQTYSTNVVAVNNDLFVQRAQVTVDSEKRSQMLLLSQQIAIDTKVSTPFQWNVINPFPLWFGIGCPVHVRLVLDEAFNAIASTLSIGDIGNTSRLMGVMQNNLAIADTYETHPLHEYVIATQVNLYLNLGVGNTQGSGTIILYFA